MRTRRVWKTTVRATWALLQIYKQFCLYCKHINVETQKSNVAALGGSVAVTFRYCFACTMQVKMYAATAAALRSINGTSLRFFLGLQLNNITSLAIDLRLRARPVKKVTVTCSFCSRGRLREQHCCDQSTGNTGAEASQWMQWRRCRTKRTTRAAISPTHYCLAFIGKQTLQFGLHDHKIAHQIPFHFSPVLRF